MLEVLIRKHYSDYDLTALRGLTVDGRAAATGDYRLEGRPTRVVSTLGRVDELAADGPVCAAGHRPARPNAAATRPSSSCTSPGRTPPIPTRPAPSWKPCWRLVAGRERPPDRGRRLRPPLEPRYLTFRWTTSGEIAEDQRIRGVHPMVARRLDLWRLREFDLTRLPAPEDVLLFDCVAKSNPADRRLVAMAQVRQLAPVRDEKGRLIGLPHAERAVENCLEAIRRTRAARGSEGNRLDMNHVWVHVWPVIDLDHKDIAALQAKITPLGEGAGIEEVLAQGRFDQPGQGIIPLAVRFHYRAGAGVTAVIEPPPTEPLKPLDDYAGRVLRARRRGLVYPYELSEVLAGPGGSIVELDLDADGDLVPVERRAPA